MRLEVDWGRTGDGEMVLGGVHVFLSKRNLETLLAHVNENSTCALAHVTRDGIELEVQAEPDNIHRADSAVLRGTQKQHKRMR